MPEQSGSIASKSTRQREIALLAGLICVLSSIIAFSPVGVVGFMESVEESNVFSIAILASLIGLVFVLLHKSGVSFGYPHEIESREIMNAAS